MNDSNQIVSKSKRRQQLLVLIAVLIISVSTVSYLTWQNHLSFKKTVIDQWYRQLLTTTSIVAVNLESFIGKFSQNLLTVANNPEIQELTFKEEMNDCDSFYCSIRNLYNIYKNDVDAILLLTKESEVIRKYPADLDIACIKGKHCLQGVRDESLLKPGETYVRNIFKNKYRKPAVTISFVSINI